MLLQLEAETGDLSIPGVCHQTTNYTVKAQVVSSDGGAGHCVDVVGGQRTESPNGTWRWDAVVHRYTPLPNGNGHHMI